MKLFISHKSDDKLYANEVYKALRQIGGVNVWVDIFELNAGDPLTVIDSSVGDSDAVVVLWSSATDASDWVRREIDTGTRNDKRIIPCILDRSLPRANPSLSERIYVDLSDRVLGMAHLCVSYVLPTALKQAGLDDHLVRRYEGYLAHSIRDIIVAGKRPEEAAYWANEADEAYGELAVWFDELIQDESTGDELRNVLEGARDIVVPAHEQLLAVLEQIAAQGPTDPDDENGLESMKEVLDQFDPDEGMEQVFRFYLRLLEIGHEEGRVDLDDMTDEEIEDDAELLHYYLLTCIDAFASLEHFAEATESEVARNVVGLLDSYVEDTNDLLPEEEIGYAGLLDDAWMIHNLAYRVHEAGLVDDDFFEHDWQMIADADTILVNSLPGDIVDALEGYLVQLVGILFDEIEGYDPEYAHDSDGNARFLMPVDVTRKRRSFWRR